MARIYKNSLCTITSPSPDPTKPLFIERDSHLLVRQFYKYLPAIGAILEQ
jgi:hypothetical protein